MYRRQILKEEYTQWDTKDLVVGCWVYPLFFFNGDEKIKIKVKKQTICKIVYNTKYSMFYLLHDNKDIDVSQNVAQAYMLVYGYIPHAMVKHIHVFPLTVSEFWHRKILREMSYQRKKT